MSRLDIPKLAFDTEDEGREYRTRVYFELYQMMNGHTSLAKIDMIINPNLTAKYILTSRTPKFRFQKTN
jgi:hypothetical protein